MPENTLTPDRLLRAYAVGLFPMAETATSTQLHWVDPKWRGIFPLDQFHISRSLRRHLIRADYQVSVNRDFSGVMQACADRAETWINPDIHRAYGQLHEMGHAHSLEVWQDGALAGGVYGVQIGAAFCGESMFSRRTDASKTALAWLIHRLRAGGFTLLDTQFLTPHLKSLGGAAITRKVYHQLLAKALPLSATFTPVGYQPSSSEVASSSIAGMAPSGRTQPITQTS